MTALMLTIDGQPVPVEACGWLMRERCGCIIAALVADQRPHHLYATAEQAHQHLTPRPASREKDARSGRRVEPVTLAFYREHIGTQWKCATHKRVTA